jgi:hypothetical protein
MDDDFRPRRTTGTIFQLGAIAFSGLAAVWGLWQASQAAMGAEFLLALLPVLLGVVAVPLLVYRLLALRGAFYHLERDGITLRWGLRVEEIPIDSVIWVRQVKEEVRLLPLPWLRWPGSVLGTRRLPDGVTLEYLAAESRGMVLIATPTGIFAISPEDPAAFLTAYQRLNELGSLSPLTARSVFPSFLLARLWRTSSARALLLGGLALNLLLLAWVILVAPGRNEVMLGFQRGGEAVPGIQLLLLPVLSSFFFLIDFFVGLFLYRRSLYPKATPGASHLPPAPYSVLAYLLWGSGALTPLLFLLAVTFIFMS